MCDLFHLLRQRRGPEAERSFFAPFPGRTKRNKNKLVTEPFMAATNQRLRYLLSESVVNFSKKSSWRICI